MKNEKKALSQFNECEMGNLDRIIGGLSESSDGEQYTGFKFCFEVSGVLDGVKDNTDIRLNDGQSED